jgi:hypothetical protein
MTLYSPRILLLVAMLAAAPAPALAQFHAGSRNREARAPGDCPPPATYIPDPAINAEDGFSTRGRRVAPATLNASPAAQQFDSVDIDMQLPLNDFIRSGRGNVNTDEMNINLGTMNVRRDGTTTLNGVPLATDSVECR